VVLDFAAVSLSLLDDESDAFLATRATIIAGQPASDTTTGTAINQHPIFTNLFIVSSPLTFYCNIKPFNVMPTLARCSPEWAIKLGRNKSVQAVCNRQKKRLRG
jgi:hypothetical protein